MPIPIVDMNKMRKKDISHFVLSLLLPISLPMRKKTNSLSPAPCSVSYLVKETSFSRTHTDNIENHWPLVQTNQQEQIYFSLTKTTRTASLLFFLSDQTLRNWKKIGGQSYLMGSGDSGRRRISEHNLGPKINFWLQIWHSQTTHKGINPFDSDSIKA
jgi:hypothetical protein